MAADSVYAGVPGVVDNPGTHPDPSRPPAQRVRPAFAGRGAQGGAGPAGRSATSTGGAGAPPVLAEGAPLGMSIMLLAHICPAGQAIRRCHHHTTPATQATHPVAIAVTTHG